MGTVNWLFLAGFAVVLVALLAGSKVIRAIAWDCLRHPFTPSRIELDGNEVRVKQLAPAKGEDRHGPPPPFGQAPSGVR
jgi:hypothetical protein